MHHHIDRDMYPHIDRNMHPHIDRDMQINAEQYHHDHDYPEIDISSIPYPHADCGSKTNNSN